MSDYKEIIVKEYHNEKGLITRREVGEELVRCKDCKHYALMCEVTGHCNWIDEITKPTDFCSYGKRKDNE